MILKAHGAETLHLLDSDGRTPISLAEEMQRGFGGSHASELHDILQLFAPLSTNVASLPLVAPKILPQSNDAGSEHVQLSESKLSSQCTRCKWPLGMADTVPVQEMPQPTGGDAVLDKRCLMGSPCDKCGRVCLVLTRTIAACRSAGEQCEQRVMRLCSLCQKQATSVPNLSPVASSRGVYAMSSSPLTHETSFAIVSHPFSLFGGLNKRRKDQDRQD